MWFAKWFGGRAREEDDEPARFAPTAAALRIESGKAARPVGRSAQAIGQAAGQSGQVRTGSKSSSGKKGFDPYNSGAFERRNAWERVGRR